MSHVSKHNAHLEPDSRPSLMASSRVVVNCTDVAYTYGSGLNAVVAVHGVHCQIRHGQRLALTGSSGSGKSTLLHLLAGLASPTAGRVTWPALGEDPAGRPGLVGVVFQGPSLIPALDVVENVALPLLLSGKTPADATELAQQALQALSLQSLSSKLPEELSGGQAQRVAIARVLATRPALILADEPTGQLDRATGAHVIDVLLHTADQLNATVLISTHDLSVAERLETRWVMRDGTLTTDNKSAISGGTTRENLR